jgi:hypothetical protein
MQVSWLEGKRRILEVWETLPELEARNVAFRKVYQQGNENLEEVFRKRI